MRPSTVPRACVEDTADMLFGAVTVRDNYEYCWLDRAEEEMKKKRVRGKDIVSEVCP